MDRIVISEPLCQQIILHVSQAIPMEAVGMIGGSPDGCARMVIEIPNLAGTHEFFADPFAQFQAEKRIAGEGLEVIAIYHSHPDGGTGLSSADLAAAARWNCAHIVIVPERSRGDANFWQAWLISEGKPTTIPIHHEN
jgi:[CysO sulfur-carrier protein]-S-L-cysteine hydrolase